MKTLFAIIGVLCFSIMFGEEKTLDKMVYGICGIAMMVLCL